MNEAKITIDESASDGFHEVCTTYMEEIDKEYYQYLEAEGAECINFDNDEEHYTARTEEDIYGPLDAVEN